MLPAADSGDEISAVGEGVTANTENQARAHKAELRDAVGGRQNQIGGDERAGAGERGSLENGNHPRVLADGCNIIVTAAKAQDRGAFTTFYGLRRCWGVDDYGLTRGCGILRGSGGRQGW